MQRKGIRRHPVSATSSERSKDSPSIGDRLSSRFKNALAHERCLRDERLRVHRMYLDLFNLLQELSALDMKLKDLTAGDRTRGRHVGFDVLGQLQHQPGETAAGRERRLTPDRIVGATGSRKGQAGQ